jgi:hypothetical protein
MKIKDLIEKLQALDPEKEIKTIEASGWECEEETKTDFEIVEYESLILTNNVKEVLSLVKANEDIRLRAQKVGVKLWEIAYVYGVNDVTFTKKLRHELPINEKEKVFKIIESLRRRES